MSKFTDDIKAYGFVVGGQTDSKGSWYWAEITPSGGPWYRQFLPWVKRWWFEINETEQEPSDELKIGVISHAYEPHGSNGAWTLRGCIIKAQAAMDRASQDEKPPLPDKEDEGERI